MRIERLELVRFGPFTETVLGFGSTGGRLEIVFGPNEAGKSTALRAIRGLLYGIPERTRDDHVHPMKELRLRGRLTMSDGRTLEVERLKRRKNSLLGPDGAPLPEAALAPFLLGISETIFVNTFGLDADALRAGAHALVEGQGEVGQSLFDAGLGGAGVHRVLSELEREAIELFNPNVRARNARLNQRLTALREANENLRRAVTTPTAWMDQKKGLDALQERLATLDAEIHRLKAEQQRLYLATTALPLLAERERLSAERRALGPGPLLAVDARERRQQAEDRLDAAVRELELGQVALAGLCERRGQLDVPERLLELDADLAAELRDRLGGHRTAARHLPERRAELATVTNEIAQLTRRLGAHETPPEPTDLELGRVRRLQLSHGELGRAARDAERALGELDARLESLRRRADAQESEPRSAQLEQAVVVARRLGDVDAAIRSLGDDIDRRERGVARALSALAPFAGSLETLPTLPVPGPETVTRFEQEERGLERRRERLAEARDDNARRVARAERELDRLGRTQSVATEEELSSARAEREADWQRVLGARRDEQEFEDVARSFEQAVERADDVADRLRREADRVADHAAKSAEVAAAVREREEVLAQAARLDEDAQRFAAEWSAAWVEAGLQPLSPREMNGWLGRRERLLGELSELDDARRHLGELQSRRADVRSTLLRLLPSTDAPESADLAPSLALAERRLADLEESRRVSKTLAETLAELAAEREIGVGERDSSARALADWGSEWARAVAPLGLAEGVTPEDVGRVLDTLAEIGKKRVEAGRLERQINGMERDAREFEADVGELVQRHAPELASLDAREAARRLCEQRDQAARDAAEAATLDRQIEASRAAENAAALDKKRAESELGQLMARAEVSDIKALSAAEDRSDEARRIDAALRRVDERLDEIRDGRSLAELARELEGLEPTAARMRLQEIEPERDELEEKRRALRADIDSAKRWLDERAASTAAIDAEGAVQRLSALARGELERYARLRLSIAVLRREIERYRELHQGPVLERANQLFTRLTDGHYSGLRPDVDSSDRPVLRCVRRNGDKVDIEGLSGGTRDQLYLALRLASLEHHAASSEGLPLILDDVLVEFDDERAKAALRGLAEVAPRFQVLLFTHHAHVVELAREVLATEQLSVTELARPEPVVRRETVVRAR